MGAIYSLFKVQTRLARLQENRLEAQEHARSILDLMVRDIKNAAYNPLGATLGNNCGGGIEGVPGVVAADATTFRFTDDFQGGAGSSPDGHCDDPDEDIEYRLDTTGCATNGDIKRRTINPSNDQKKTDCNVTSLDLRYFTQAGAELARPVSATDLANIQRVLITLTVQSKYPDPEFGGQLKATMTSNVNLRNRGLSQ
jgi:hypothetical protein